VLTRTSAIGYLNSVTVAHVTTTIRGAPTEVVLTEADGLPERCVVSLDNIHTVRKTRTGHTITHLSSTRMREVREAIEFALGFNEMG
jgi:mRNA interferase MazF